MILFLISFLAGVLTVLAPCTISLLPVIVGGSIGGGHSSRRSLTVVISLGVSIILFTLILKVSTLFINIPQSFWQVFSGSIILLLGLIMLFPAIWEHVPFINKLNLGSNRLLASGYKKENMAGDIIMGAALGPVFSTCSPTYFLILATVLPKSFSAGIIYLLAYVVGLCGFLFIITFLSGKAVEKLGIISDDRGWLKKIIGIIFLLLGLAIIFGFDQKIELALSNKIFDVTKIEQNFLTNDISEAPQNKPAPSAAAAPDKNISPDLSASERIKVKEKIYKRAPEITAPSGFINTSGAPITLGQFKGKKVVLVDFWTYSCINCLRTLPYLSAWYKKYSDQGLEIVSIHTPEFAFEKVQKNVQDAVNRLGIKYPVVMDNNYGTWNAFGNQYWPREYLVDIDGFIVHDAVGEGAYDETEAAIQKALTERADILGTGKISSGIVAPTDVINMDPNQVGSQETYFGTNRAEPGASYLSGAWNLTPEYAETSDTNAKIIYKYNAKNVYFVASSPLGSNIKVYLDQKLVKTVFIKDNKLYTLIEGTDYGEHTLEIDVTSGTLDAYTFTFG